MVESTCLDAGSGLFHWGHFLAVLDQELARLDRWEKPLSLILLEMGPMTPGDWGIVGRLVRSCLRGIDLAARRDDRVIGVIMPDAGLGRSRRWLMDILPQLSQVRSLKGCCPTFGRAVARPWEGCRGEAILAAALATFGKEDLLEPSGEADDFSATSGTAIAADERNLLFDGFKALEIGPKH